MDREAHPFHFLFFPAGAPPGLFQHGLFSSFSLLPTRAGDASNGRAEKRGRVPPSAPTPLCPKTRTHFQQDTAREGDEGTSPNAPGPKSGVTRTRSKGNVATFTN